MKELNKYSNIVEETEDLEQNTQSEEVNKIQQSLITSIKKDINKNYYSKFQNMPIAARNEFFVYLTLGLIFTFTSIGFLFLENIDLYVKFLMFLITLFFYYKSISQYFSFTKSMFLLFSGFVVDIKQTGFQFSKIDKIIYLTKIENEEGKILCFKQYSKLKFNIGDEVTLFLPEYTEVEEDEYGPTVNYHLAAVLTSSLNSDLKQNVINKKTSTTKKNVSDYLN